MRASVSLQRLSPATIAGGLAAASLFAALLFAALNALALASGAVVTAATFVGVGAVAAAYRALPAEDREHLLSRRVVRSTAITSLLLAIGVSCTYWYVGWGLFLDPIPISIRELIIRHWHKLDFIPSIFSLLLPMGWRSGFHQYFNGLTYCFPGEHWWETMRYLRTAIPGYAVTFFLALLLGRLLWATMRRFARPASV